ncbi:MAG: LysM peptidoglycan-binding domain-containing protein, partial [Exilispira sp.]
AVTEQTTSPPIIYEEKTAEKVIQPQATKEVTQKTTQPYQTTTTKETVKISESEKKVGVDGKIITAKNIQTYHSILLKEFEKEDIFSYKIIWGDTLWKIALKFNTTAHTLYVLNALDNPDLIIAGKYLKVVKDFKLPKEKTEKILKEAIKGKTGYNNIENSFACINNIFNIMQIDILSLFKNEESII